MPEKNEWIMNKEIIQRLQQIKEFGEEFTSVPRVESKGLCRECKEGILEERDKVESADGAGVWVTTLYYCSRCGYRNVGDTYWTSDY